VCLVSKDALSQGLSIGATLAVVGSVLSLLRIVAVGGPASGKGTQCARVVKEFGVVHVSTGELEIMDGVIGFGRSRAIEWWWFRHDWTSIEGAGKLLSWGEKNVKKICKKKKN
jgi:hypothetical protein